MLEQLSEIRAVESQYFHEGKPDDAVFKTLATIPMTGIHQGMPPFPFDLDELTRLIENEPKV